MRLTKDANKLRRMMCKTYVQQVRNGKSQLEARWFGNYENLILSIPKLTKVDERDVRDWCLNLREAGIVEGEWWLMNFCDLRLTHQAIADWQNRGRDKVKIIYQFLVSILEKIKEAL
ncbi:MAG: hypothetical protein LBD16_08280 [Oscillospiraceae bacterium]|jgi:hypothetical protein|nr:hypothetical protein [Oscillospiraceae bacterium]